MGRSSVFVATVLLITISWSPHSRAGCSWIDTLKCHGAAARMYSKLAKTYQQQINEASAMLRENLEEEQEKEEEEHRHDMLNPGTQFSDQPKREEDPDPVDIAEYTLNAFDLWDDLPALQKLLGELRSKTPDLSDWIDCEHAALRIQLRIEALEKEKYEQAAEAIPRFDLRTLASYDAAVQHDEIPEDSIELKSSDDEEQVELDDQEAKQRAQREAARLAHQRRLDYLKNPFAVDQSTQEEKKEEEDSEGDIPEGIVQSGLNHIGISMEDVGSNFTTQPRSPYHLGMRDKLLRTLREVVMVVIDPDQRPELEWRVLNYHFARACEFGDVTSMRMLMNLGASVHSIDEIWGDTPLHEAAGHGQVAAVSLLLSLGARVDAKTKKEAWTPLHMAAATGSDAIVSLLLRSGAVADARANAPYGHTPLDIAEFYGYDAPHAVGRSLRAAGGTLTVSTWYNDVEKQTQQILAQRKMIKEESKGKFIEPGPAFRPTGYSITVDLGTRDTRDPNRHGHKKRTMMDSMDLLKFRHTQNDRSDADGAVLSHMTDVADILAGDGAQTLRAIKLRKTAEAARAKEEKEQDDVWIEEGQGDFQEMFGTDHNTGEGE